MQEAKMQDVIIIQRGQVFISKKGETELLSSLTIINISYIFSLRR
jgi:hypothetical protein